MCGISGVFRISSAEPVSRAVIEAMTQTMVHRGPDDSGYALYDRAALGFRRLSIIDLSTGNQPILSEDGTLCLVCNGEIFNYRELRDELLAKGHRFRTRTDVEVLLHLYEEMGERMLDRLNGQFAFALYDRTRERLFLARDHFGVVPLFHASVDGSLVFASEIKAILAHPRLERRVDLTGLDQIMSLPGLVSPRTMFEGVESLPPGHCMTVDSRGIRCEPYWDLIYPPACEPAEARSEESWREECEHRLTQAVKRRLHADVPVGAYLSGGLDSSLITALMRESGAGSIESFSIAFTKELLDERKYQRLMAERLGSRHHEIDLGIDGIESRLRSVVWHCECPLKESYDTASLALSAAARQHGVPVVLSGEGADELFAGYIGYRYDAFRCARGTPAPVTGREAELRRRLWGDESIFYENQLSQHETLRKSLYSPAMRALFEDFEFSRHRILDPERLAGIHPLHQRSYLDMKLRLADHLLGDHGDRMLLANSVEGRFPFLDVEVADLARRMPPDLKLRGFEEKHILKAIGRKHLPQAIVDREKYAFNAPGSPDLLRSGIGWVEDLLSPDTIRRQGYFDPAAVETLKQRFRQPDFTLAGSSDEDMIMIVLTFGIFLEVFDMPHLG